MSEPKETSQTANDNTGPDSGVELQQKVRQLEETLQRREDELATAEAQRDEIHMRLCEAENRVVVERSLSQAGVVDVEAALLLLTRRVDLAGGDERAMMASLARLAALDPELTVYPGHGPATTIGAEAAKNPWLADL